MSSASLPKLWATCVDRLKDRVNNRSFWEALEHTHAVTIDGDTFVVGMEAESFNRAGFLQPAAMMNVIHEVVKQVIGLPLQVRLIDGITLKDWEAAQAYDARVAAMRDAVPVARVSVSGGTWEALSDRISRLYAQAPLRALPQGKARYANEALYLLMEEMDTLFGEGENEQSERNLARVLERIANASEIPSAVLAFELERLRAWRKASEDGQDQGDTQA